MTELTISVIIPTRNRRAWLLACLASLAGQSYPPARFEIVVVDDFSANDTSAAVTA